MHGQVVPFNSISCAGDATFTDSLIQELGALVFGGKHNFAKVMAPINAVVQKVMDANSLAPRLENYNNYMKTHRWDDAGRAKKKMLEDDLRNVLNRRVSMSDVLIPAMKAAQIDMC